MKIRLDCENGGSMGMGKVGIRKVWRFSSNKICENFGCLILAPSFDVGGLILWNKEEEQKISSKERNICSIRVKVNLYEVFVYSILFLFLFITL